MPKPDRRLAPIVSLDVVGYTRHVQHNERQTLRLVRTAYVQLVERTIADAGGKVFKTMGDGLLAEFASVVAAVEWVAEAQKSLNGRAIRLPGGGLFEVRAGIVLADVLVSGDDLFGDGVNLAVRVQDKAPPGGMAITKWMHEYLGGRVDLTFIDLGPTELKNIPRTVRLFAWHPEGPSRLSLAKAPTPADQLVRPPSQRPSVVVLPFDNLSGEADQAYFADAVVEEITATLARVRDFYVIARNSAFAYKGRSVDVRQVGRELGVRYAVEGSVRRVGERVRITAQLIETETGNHIWSNKVDGGMADLFDLQDRMAAEVASALQPSIRRVEIERARGKRPETLAAYDHVMRAMPHIWAHLPEDNLKAIAQLEQALALEPEYALAAALCAWAHGQQVIYQWTADIDGERARARAMIERASRVVGDDPTALTALASAIMQTGGDTEHSLRLVEQALALDANLAWAWMRRGFGLVYSGRTGEAIASFERALRLSPLDPFTFNIHVGIGLAHFAEGRVQDAIRYGHQALVEKPGISWPWRDLAVYYGHHGDLAAASDALERFRAVTPQLSLRGVGESLRLMNSSLLARYLQGLKLAGLN